MATTLDYAKLSQAAYSEETSSVSNQRSGATWRKKAHYSVAGFYAALYVNTDVKASESVLAFRGTEVNDLFDIAADVQLASNLPPYQANIAINFTRGVKQEYPGLILTGHSLGGALAILVAAALNLRAYTFNAPGVVDECITFAVRQEIFSRNATLSRITSAINNCLANPGIQNYRISGDPVSSIYTTGRQVGSTTEMNAASCSRHDLLCKHGINTVVNQLQAWIQ